MFNNSIFDEACSALKQSNCKTLVAFSNCPETHDVFVKAAKAGILDQLPFPTESVTYADCLELLDEVDNRKTLQREYRRHYQVIANVDGLLDERYGIDEDAHVSETNMMIMEFWKKILKKSSNSIIELWKIAISLLSKIADK